MMTVMRMTVYLDVLLLTNLWVDYAMLCAVSRVSRSPMRGLRGVLGAGVGALSALTILLPHLPLWLTLLLRLLSGCAMTAAAFGFGGIRRFLGRLALLAVISVFFCGTVAAFCQLRRPAGLYIQNSYIYADVSLLTLLFCATAAAAVSSVLSRRAQRSPDGEYQLHLRIGGHDMLMPALSDSGNLLQDSFTGKPVAVCGEAALSHWLADYPDAQTACASQRGFRLLTVHTVAGTELIPACSPDFAAVRGQADREELPVDMLIAVSRSELPRAVVPACCLRGCKGGTVYEPADTLDRHYPAVAAKQRL